MRSSSVASRIRIAPTLPPFGKVSARASAALLIVGEAFILSSASATSRVAAFLTDGVIIAPAVANTPLRSAPAVICAALSLAVLVYCSLLSTTSLSAVPAAPIATCEPMRATRVPWAPGMNIEATVTGSIAPAAILAKVPSVPASDSTRRSSFSSSIWFLIQAVSSGD